MTSLSTFQDASKTLTITLLKEAPATLQQLQKGYQEHFPPVSHSSVKESYSSNITSNASLSAAIGRTLDVCDSVLDRLAALERYISLTIPKMEDGNNFGVTIQLAVLKAMSDTQDKIGKGVDELAKYERDRADAMEKCKQLPSSTTITTSTTTSSNAEGNNNEKGDTKSQEQKKSTEEKKTTTLTESPELTYRQQAVVSIDLVYYTKAKSLFASAMTGYMAAVDLLEKNAEKVAHPKGSEQGRSAYSSMY